MILGLTASVLMNRPKEDFLVRSLTLTHLYFVFVTFVASHKGCDIQWQQWESQYRVENITYEYPLKCQNVMTFA